MNEVVRNECVRSRPFIATGPQRHTPREHDLTKQSSSSSSSRFYRELGGSRATGALTQPLEGMEGASNQAPPRRPAHAPFAGGSGGKPVHCASRVKLTKLAKERGDVGFEWTAGLHSVEGGDGGDLNPEQH